MDASGRAAIASLQVAGFVVSVSAATELARADGVGDWELVITDGGPIGSASGFDTA